MISLNQGNSDVNKGNWVKMDDLAHTDSTGKSATQREEDVEQIEVMNGANGSATSAQHDAQHGAQHEESRRGGRSHRRSYSHTHFRVYKRRWFGLLQLVLLNIVVSWDVRIHPFKTLS